MIEYILVIACIITGVIYALDALFLRKKRIQKLNAVSQDTEYKEPFLIDLSRSFFPVLLLVIILRSFIIDPWRIPSASMKPTLYEGDYIIVNKFKYGLRLPILGTKVLELGAPKRGDIVVFKNPKVGLTMIKRVIGLPGDRIEYRDNKLIINGKPTKVDYISKDYDYDINSNTNRIVERHTENLDDIEHPIFLQSKQRTKVYPYEDIVVPENSYFMVGDNRNNSSDSRFWGFVDDENLVGKAMIVLGSWDHRHFDFRWSRFFTLLN